MYTSPCTHHRCQPGKARSTTVDTKLVSMHINPCTPTYTTHINLCTPTYTTHHTHQPLHTGAQKQETLLHRGLHRAAVCRGCMINAIMYHHATASRTCICIISPPHNSPPLTPPPPPPPPPPQQLLHTQSPPNHSSSTISSKGRSTRVDTCMV